MELLVKKLHPDATAPKRMLGAAVGYDLFAYIKQAEGRPSRAIVPPHTVKIIPTGVCCMLRLTPTTSSVPYLQVTSRGSLTKRCLSVANAPGIVDPDYTGEIFVLLMNSGYETQYIAHGDRVAQLVVAYAAHPSIVEVAEFASTVRGAAWHGSTGA